MDLADVAPAFVEMAHRIVWCSAATVEPNGRPRSRVLHPVWVLEDSMLTGWIGTSPTPVKVSHLDANPYVSCLYLAANHDTCTAECAAELVYDDATRIEVWERFKNAPAPVGYDPAIVPVWTSPTAPTFVAMRLTPWRLRVMPGTLMLEGTGDLLTWQA